MNSNRLTHRSGVTLGLLAIARIRSPFPFCSLSILDLCNEEAALVALRPCWPGAELREQKCGSCVGFISRSYSPPEAHWSDRENKSQACGLMGHKDGL